MQDIESTPLGQFRKKAKMVTLVSAGIAIVLAIIAGASYASAQSSYSDYISSSSDLDSYLSDSYDDDDDDSYSWSSYTPASYSTGHSYSLASYRSDRALSRYQSNSTAATVCLYLAVAASGVTGIAAVAWVGASLLIANKQTVLASQGLALNRAPMELDDYVGAKKPAIGSTILFKQAGDVLVAKTIFDEPAGTLNKEFAARLMGAGELEKISAVVTTYHGNHPVIEIIANA